ncbi:rubrerythrin family protein [Pseudodesulfovibrio sp. zrk46]|uniref:rubrerythrin family protein n=1 Tax=Pseudodesulfovibrio sp. zrk46 TaxID=2725288 RepID=UPI001448D35D|nr:rubrerythrin family protein [Pseudodesulfovibrio sp. zrk46]QJB55796.1 rubrerythrin family protein [Pseudodesulfovibrio sp. zrk46]
MTKSDQNMAELFAERSTQAARNEIRALKADKDGRAKEARFFRALAQGQKVHAAKLLLLMRGLAGSTDDNLAAALAEVESSSDALSDMIMVAATDRNALAETAFTQFMRASDSHAVRLNNVSADEGNYHVCSICGFIVPDTVPERCPVCRAVPEQFRAVE